MKLCFVRRTILVSAITLCTLSYGWADARTVVDRAGDAVVSVTCGRAGGQSLGSGFVVDPRGYVLSNAHVVDKATWIRVKLANGREVPGHVCLQDSDSDLAVIRVQVRNLPVVVVGNAKSARSGDGVVAIGCPHGLEHTVTSGIVSSSDREIGGRHYIQTDAALNEGNSGGPLLNEKCEVIGINTMIEKDASRLGFAVPINAAYGLLKSADVAVVTTLDNKELAASRRDDRGRETSANATHAPAWTLLLAACAMIAGVCVVVALVLMRRRRARRRPQHESPLAISLRSAPAEEADDLDIELR